MNFKFIYSRVLHPFRVLAVIILIGFIAFNAQAATGCYVAGKLYTSTTTKGARYFLPSPFTTAPCYTGTLSGTCYIYDGSGNVSQNSNYVSYTNSYSSNFTVVSCPIDNYVWVLILGAALMYWAKRRFTFSE